MTSKTTICPKCEGAGAYEILHWFCAKNHYVRCPRCSGKGWYILGFKGDTRTNEEITKDCEELRL